MLKRTARIALVLASVAAVGTATAATATAADGPPGSSRATLTGPQETGRGDSNGFGRAVVDPRPLQDSVCVNIRYFGIDTPTVAHIHEAPYGVAGDVVVDLTPLLLSSPDSYLTGCVPVDTILARDIKRNAEDYYVNIHTEAFPDGAIRGQLYYTVTGPN